MKSYLKNLKGEEIDTKEKTIKALIHTANFEQLPIKNLWCFEEQCQLFGICKDGFYKQKLCEECNKYGVEISNYKDDDFAYEYEYNCPNCLLLGYDTLEEWKVLRNGKTWTDRFESEDWALEYIEVECKDLDGEFSVEKMTNEEIKAYE